MSSATRITLLVVDDHPMIRDGLAAMIDAEDDLVLIAEAANGVQAVDAYRARPVDVVLMDLRMPVMDGVTAIQSIRAEFPLARIIALTTYDGDADIHRALSAGAQGYLLKDALRTELVQVIRTVHRGFRGIAPGIASRLAEHMPRADLTPRELEVLRLLARGGSNHDIAAALGRTEGTVKVHVANILQKLEVGDRTQAVVVALRRGIIHLE